MLILKGNSLVKGISDTNTDILVMNLWLFYKRKLAYYATFLRLMYVNLTRRKFFVFKFLESHQLSQGMLYIKLFLIYFEKFHFLVYRIRYLHSADVIWWRIVDGKQSFSQNTDGQSFDDTYHSLTLFNFIINININI